MTQMLDDTDRYWWVPPHTATLETTGDTETPVSTPRPARHANTGPGRVTWITSLMTAALLAVPVGILLGLPGKPQGGTPSAQTLSGTSTTAPAIVQQHRAVNAPARAAQHSQGIQGTGGGASKAASMTVTPGSVCSVDDFDAGRIETGTDGQSYICGIRDGDEEFHWYLVGGADPTSDPTPTPTSSPTTTSDDDGSIVITGPTAHPSHAPSPTHETHYAPPPSPPAETTTTTTTTTTSSTETTTTSD